MTEPAFEHQGDWAPVLVALDAEPGSAYVLGPDLSLRHVNKAWGAFAIANGAPLLATNWRSGKPVDWSFAPPLGRPFAHRLARVLASDETWTHAYECSAPGLFRRFQMLAYAGPHREGLVVVHSLVEEATLPVDPVFQLRLSEFTDQRGLVSVCAACGRAQRPLDGGAWEWFPGLNECSAALSHGICPLCALRLYGELAVGDQP